MSDIAPPPLPNIGRKIARNTLFVTLGQILLKIFGFLFGVFVVRQLGDEQYGRYSIVVAWVGLFSIFVELGVTQFVMREMARSGARATALFWNLIGIRLMLALIGLVVIPLTSLVVGYESDITLGVLLYVVTFVISAFHAPLDAVLTAREAFGWTTLLTIVGQIAWLILGTIVMGLRPSFLWLLAVGLAAMLPQLILAIWVTRRHDLVEWPPRFQPAEWPRLMRAGFPFAVISLALTIAFSIDTVMLSWFVSDAEVGWYNVAYGLVRSFVSLLTGFSVAMVPTLARVFVTDAPVVGRWHAHSTRLIAFLSLPLAVGGMLLADPLIRFLYTPDIFPAARALAIIIWDIPLLMYAATCGNVTTIIGEERSAARINTLNAIANITLNALLIPWFGMLAAAAVTVITDLLAVIQFDALLRRKLVLPSVSGALIKVIAACIGMSAAVLLTGEWHVVLRIGLGGAVYAVLILATGFIEPEEWGLLKRVLRIRKT